MACVARVRARAALWLMLSVSTMVMLAKGRWIGGKYCIMLNNKICDKQESMYASNGKRFRRLQYVKPCMHTYFDDIERRRVCMTASYYYQLLLACVTKSQDETDPQFLHQHQHQQTNVALRSSTNSEYEYEYEREGEDSYYGFEMSEASRLSTTITTTERISRQESWYRMCRTGAGCCANAGNGALPHQIASVEGCARHFSCNYRRLPCR